MKYVRRRYFCHCSGVPVELVLGETFTHDEDEPVEAFCPKCGARPSSDPKHTISFRDELPGVG